MAREDIPPPVARLTVQVDTSEVDAAIERLRQAEALLAQEEEATVARFVGRGMQVVIGGVDVSAFVHSVQVEARLGDVTRTVVEFWGAPDLQDGVLRLDAGRRVATAEQLERLRGITLREDPPA